MRSILVCGAFLLSVPRLLAADYHIDFSAGDDAADGRTPASAWQHGPGDPAATGNAAAVKLQAGDRVLLKGGVEYRGSLTISAAGEAGRPIVIDGGAWGTGRAVVMGGEPVTGWTRCASPEEAKGNPRWAEIFSAEVPRPKGLRDLNLCDAAGPLPIAQHPNPADWFWQEHMDRFLAAPVQLIAVGGLRLAAEAGTQENKQQPLANLLTGGAAVIGPVPGGGFTYTLPEPAGIAAVAVAVQAKYAALREFAVLGDGRELARFSLARNDKGVLQRFDLPAPARVATLSFRFLSLHDGEEGNWSKLRQVAAFTADGTDVLRGAGAMTFADAANLAPLSGGRADWFDGMTFAFHAGNNHIFYLPIRGFDPGSGTLTLPVFGEGQYRQTRYCLLNSVRLIDQPGESSVDLAGSGRTARVFLLPRSVVAGQPAGVTRAARGDGVVLAGASQVVVQNLVLRQQSKGALSARDGKDLVLRACEVTQVDAGVAVGASRIDGLLVEDLHVHDNPGHTKGLVLHTCSRAEVRGNRLQRNTSTAIDLYACSGARVAGNTVRDHLGSHANGLTFYVGCKDILVERNLVTGGNCALTFQEGEGLIFRNNLLDSCGRTTVVGIWPSQPLRNVQFLNNTIVRGNAASDYQTGLFSNSRRIEGLVVRNNIIDGLFTDHGVFKGQTFANNLYTRLGKDQQDGLLGSDERVETDLARIFVDPGAGDFRLRAGSPAIGAGGAEAAADDLTGAPRPAGRSDLGAYAFRE